jgi:carbamoyl-phosphate synthase large subunit
MKTVKVLVTGAGGMIGIGIAKSLRFEFKKKIKIEGTDCSKFAPTFFLPYLLDGFSIVPKAKDRNYIPKMLSLAKRKKIDIIFPGTDHEILPLSQEKKLFEKKGIKIIVSPPDTIKICNDKWLTYKELKNKLPIVQSFLPPFSKNKSLARKVGFPLIIKPRFGWGSRDIYKAGSASEIKVLLNKVKKPVIQKWLKGEEYTIDGLVNKDGKAVCVIPRKRMKTIAGVSSLGVTVKDKKLINLGEKISDVLRIQGPFNFQVRKDRNKYFILEINPRFAGTGILSVVAGANLPALALKEALGMKIPSSVSFKEGVMVTRYIEDVFISKNKVFNFDS